jgi:hypothetical protein
VFFDTQKGAVFVMAEFREMVEQMLEDVDLQLEKDYSNFEVEMIYFAATDIHQATKNLLKLGKRAGERSARKEREVNEWNLNAEISRLKQENRKLQRQVKKLGETA